MVKFRKMFVGTVRTPGSTYYVHEWFAMQGFFSLKITPLGANMVLIEETEDRVMEELQANYIDWLYAKFDNIRRWDPNDADVERVVWVRCHSVPVHAWTNEFFKAIARNFGELIDVDEVTDKRSSMDVRRLRLRTRGFDVFNAVVTANINGSLFHIKVVEEWCGPIQWLDDSRRRNERKNDDASDDGDSYNEGPLLGDDWGSNFEEGWEDKGSLGEEEELNEEEEGGVEYDKVLTDKQTNVCIAGEVELQKDVVATQNNSMKEGSEEQVEDSDEGDTHISNTIVKGVLEVATQGGISKLTHQTIWLKLRWLGMRSKQIQSRPMRTSILWGEAVVLLVGVKRLI